MDNFCIMAARLIDWIERTETPPLPWVGSANGRISNPPAKQIELLYAPSGGFTNLMIGDRECRIPGGHVAIYNVHFGNEGPAPENDAECWGVFFDVSGTSAFKDLEKAPFFASVPVTEPDRIKGYISSIQRRCLILFGGGWGYPHGKPAYPDGASQMLRKSSRIFVKAPVLELLASVLQEGETAGDAGEELPRALRDSLAYISQHYADPEVFLGSLAAICNLSEDHFGRLFRQHLGVSPMQYLQRYRIEKSWFLLVHTSLYIEEIAAQVGFRDAFYFSRVFRKHTGVSPTEYRQTRAASEM